MTAPFTSRSAILVGVTLQSKAYADAEDAEFQLGADLEERGGMSGLCHLLRELNPGTRAWSLPRAHSLAQPSEEVCAFSVDEATKSRVDGVQALTRTGSRAAMLNACLGWALLLPTFMAPISKKTTQ